MWGALCSEAPGQLGLPSHSSPRRGGRLQNHRCPVQASCTPLGLGSGFPQQKWTSGEGLWLRISGMSPRGNPGQAPGLALRPEVFRCRVWEAGAQGSGKGRLHPIRAGLMPRPAVNPGSRELAWNPRFVCRVWTNLPERRCTQSFLSQPLFSGWRAEPLCQPRTGILSPPPRKRGGRPPNGGLEIIQSNSPV